MTRNASQTLGFLNAYFFSSKGNAMPDNEPYITFDSVPHNFLETIEWILS